MNVASRLPFPATASLARRGDLPHKLVGLMLAALLPALFWVAFTAAAASALGYAIAPSALTVLGSAISLFLASVCAPIMLRA